MARGTVRLDRALSKLGLASRGDARRLILSGRVRVNGRVRLDPAERVVPERLAVEIDGQRRTADSWRTIAFHKPRGVVTTRRDPQGRPTVFDVLGDAARGLVAVGRLDMASTGLLLLTSDTQLANALTDPDRAVARRYVVTVRGRLDDSHARRLVEEGVGGMRATRAAVTKRSSRETHLIVELTEGRNREIRRMLAALGYEVTRLLRVAFGTIELGTLQPGRWRNVPRAEIGPGYKISG